MKKMLIALAVIACLSVGTSNAANDYFQTLNVGNLNVFQKSSLKGPISNTGAFTNVGAMSNTGAFTNVGAMVNTGTLGVTGLSTLTGGFLVNPSTRTASDAYVYITKITGNVHTGGAATKTYSLGILTDRPSGSPASGDSNDALIRGSHNNYAANDTNFIMRGINMSLANRSGGVLGFLDNALGNQNKSGGTVGSITGLTVTPENYGTVSDLFGGVDVVMKNEGAVATSEFGVRVRNLNNSLGTAVGAGYLLSDTGANIGFTYGADFNGATIGTADLRLHSGDTITNAAAGTTTFSGAVALGGAAKLYKRTLAQILAITPAVGDAYICSDCVVPYSMAVATGTSAGQFGIFAPGTLQ
jgi:hypothetical protein